MPHATLSRGIYLKHGLKMIDMIKITKNNKKMIKVTFFQGCHGE